MEKVIGVCGCICSDCRIYEKECKGCYAIEGKPCWLHEVGLEICDFYECCVLDKGLEHCGQCKEIPCDKFWKNKNPAWREEQHKKIVEERVALLKRLLSYNIVDSNKLDI
ncbi:DUF3795 domain-containing protein [Thermococci archaeon]|nr:MAG: DUF3795 domain-containing protein [Thermococci archaeon]